MKYTQEQLDIFSFVQHGTGHGIIDAVAGAGKTTTIMESVAYVPKGTRMLFCAFNKSISKEISSRFRKKGMNDVVVKTIHALGYGILKAHNTHNRALQIEDKKFQKLIKSEELQELLKPHYKEIILINKLDPEDTVDKNNQSAVKSLVYRIERRLLNINQKYRATLCKNDLNEFTDLVKHFGIFNSIEAAKENFEQELALYFTCHQILLREGNELSKRSMIFDFTDMLFLPYEWELYPVQKFDFVFIDECQDLSRSQLAICLKFCKSSARIMAVGDPRQSIYGFTGADIESFDRVKDTTRAQQLPLTTCFRCPQEVIKIAKEIRSDIEGNKEEAGIVQSIDFDNVVNFARPGDLIISRIKAPLVVLVFDFIDKGIKVQIHEEEANEFLKELKSLFKQNERQKRFAAFAGGFEELKQMVIKRREYMIRKDAERIVSDVERDIVIKAEIEYLHQRLDFLHKKSIKWAADCFCIDDILKRIWDYITAKENPIKLSSIHRAKGLEENRVFVIDYDALPHLRLEIQDWEVTQEINLKYVAVTRAKEELYLVKSGNLEEEKDEGNLFDDLFIH